MTGMSGGGISSQPFETEASARVWRLALVACALGVAIQSGFSSLSDPDLPTHLSTAEWILAHGSVPYTEPFAWTRSGAPFYAYSWLAQLAMFALYPIAMFKWPWHIGELDWNPFWIGMLGLFLFSATTAAQSATVMVTELMTTSLRGRSLRSVSTFCIASTMSRPLTT